MQDYLRDFGALLSGARIRLGKKQKDMAVEMGINKNTIAPWETGLTLPPPKNLPLIVRAYEIDQNTLRTASTSRKIKETHKKTLENR